jgi:hypothetical protein
MEIDDIVLKPIEKANAHNINTVSLSIIPLAMLQLENLADFLTEEPAHIRIKINEKDSYHSFEQVLRIRIWLPNQRTYSWCIYSEEREWSLEEGNAGGLIIRYADWDRSFDMQKVRNKKKDKQEKKNEWPTLDLLNLYFNPKNSLELLKRLYEVDNCLFNGVKLRKRESSEAKPDWNDLEVMRRFNWGQIHNTWSPYMVNEEIENIVITLDEELNLFRKKNPDNIFQMDLDYSFPIEIKKALVYKE